MSKVPEQGEFTPVKRALIALEKLQARVHELESRAKEPIAIVGMACRFPGGADTPGRYWELLERGVNAVSTTPADRWRVDEFHHRDPDFPGRGFCNVFAHVDQIDQFDAEYFGLSPREAQSVDPQQRLLLEVTVEALENGGLPSTSLIGSKTGVYVGVSTRDFGDLFAQFTPSAVERIDAYMAPGTATSAAAGRISYFLGLKGPSITFDTACSSSLVAIHEACAALRSGECELAIAGAVNLIFSPLIFVSMTKLRSISPSGATRAFDAGADGYVRGEGCGVVLLKRLSAAVADGDRIFAVVRGSAVSQNGMSGSLSAPHGPSQVEVIRAALQRAGVAPDDIGYVEAHGTGTPMGDAIELEALRAAVAAERAGAPLLIGSVKTNLGHLEAAAGMASVIKVALSLEHGQIPKQLNFAKGNAGVDWDTLGLQVVSEQVPWPPGKRRIAGVSAFAFTGTNCHLVLEESPPWEARADLEARQEHVLFLSAKSAKALRDQARRHATFVAETLDLKPEDLSAAAISGRAHHAHRLAVLYDDMRSLSQRLHAWAGGENLDGVFAGVAADLSPRTGFAFGPLARADEDAIAALRSGSTDFARSWDAVEVAFKRVGGQGLAPGVAPDVVRGFALAHSIARTWFAWGTDPAVVSGEGAGALVAAAFAGAISVDDALRILLATESGSVAVESCLATVRIAQPRWRLLRWRDAAPIEQGARAVDCWLPRSEAGPACDEIFAGVDAVLLIADPSAPGTQRRSFSIAPAPGAPWRPALRALCELYVSGFEGNWSGIAGRLAKRHAMLPNYPFQRSLCWVPWNGGEEGRPSREPVGLRRESDGALPDPVLGQPIRVAGLRGLLEWQLGQSSAACAWPFVGRDLLCGLDFVGMSMAGRRLLESGRHVAIAELEMDTPLFIAPGEQVRIQLVVFREDQDGSHRFELASSSGGDASAEFDVLGGGRYVEWDGSFDASSIACAASDRDCNVVDLAGIVDCRLARLVATARAAIADLSAPLDPTEPLGLSALLQAVIQAATCWTAPGVVMIPTRIEQLKALPGAVTRVQLDRLETASSGLNLSVLCQDAAGRVCVQIESAFLVDLESRQAFSNLGSTDYLQALRAMEPTAREDELIRSILESCARILRLDEAAELRSDAQFAALGLDSLMTLELRNALTAKLGLYLAPAIGLRFPTPRDLAAVIHNLLLERFLEMPQDGQRAQEVFTI